MAVHAVGFPQNGMYVRRASPLSELQVTQIAAKSGIRTLHLTVHRWDVQTDSTLTINTFGFTSSNYGLLDQLNRQVSFRHVSHTFTFGDILNEYFDSFFLTDFGLNLTII